MKFWHQLMNQATIRFIDHTFMEQFNDEPFTALTSFSIDDALTIAVSNQTSEPIIRLWNHQPTVVLGIPDGRLPYIQEGLEWIEKHGYQALIRNSGGLAVVLDENILNISLIFHGAKSTPIHDAYELMYEFIQFVLRDYTNQIEAYEIVGSYCPGDFDLSIGGKKFAGISQRRVHNGVAVQIYVDVAGDSYKRASLIRDFYQISLKGEETTFNYPTVIPEKMTSLSELLDQPISVNLFKELVIQAIHELSQQVIMTPISANEMKDYQTRLAHMIKRNERVKR